MSETAAIDPAEWLRARGWTHYSGGKAGEYWRRTPNEPGWEGGWNLSGAVHLELEADNRETLKRMGLYRPPVRKGRR